MKVAIFSDVHGNLTALEAVLADIKRQEPDITFFAGDLCLLGARPKECLQLLEATDIAAVYGNTDEAISNQPDLTDHLPLLREQQLHTFDDLKGWTLDQIGSMGQAALRTWPFQRRVSPTSHPKDDLFIVHANPVDVNQPIFPDESVQKAIYDEIKQPDDDPDLRHLLSNLETGIMAYGHVHIPNIREWRYGDNAITLVNISSVSLPLDGDSRAKYGLFNWTADSGWKIEHQYVAYNLEQEREIINQIKPPDWVSMSQRLG